MPSPVDLFLESRVNRSDHRVYGYRLHPLCLLDLVALEAAGSPVLTGGTIRDYELALAAFLLSRPIERDLSIRPARPPKTLALRVFIQKFETQKAAFEAYLEDYLTFVPMWREDGESGTPLGAHWIQSLATFLARNTSMSQQEIWASPLGHVLWLASSIEEQVGSARVKTADDEAAEAAALENAGEIEKLKAVEIQQIEARLLRDDIKPNERARLTNRLAKLKGLIS